MSYSRCRELVLSIRKHFARDMRVRMFDLFAGAVQYRSSELPILGQRWGSHPTVSRSLLRTSSQGLGLYIIRVQVAQ